MQPTDQPSPNQSDVTHSNTDNVYGGGVVEKGNIDLSKRKPVPFQGGFATVYSMSFQDDSGNEVLIPRVVDGKVVSAKAAIQNYYDTGQHLGKFDSVKSADLAAKRIHLSEQERISHMQSNDKLKPQAIASTDVRDTNKDGTWDVSEQKTWTAKSQEDVYGDWGFDLEAIKELGLAPYFDAQFQLYKKNPTGWSEDTFKRGLKKLPEFQAQSSAYQEDLQYELTNNPQWKVDVQGDVDTLRDKVNALGAPVDDATLRDLAIKQRRGGLNASQMANVLAGYIKSGDGNATGAAGRNREEISKWSIANGVTLSSGMLDGYVKEIAAGNQSFDDVKGDLRRTYLAGAYPAWADKINAGFDPSDIFRPYVDNATTLLERPITLSDPVMQKITQAVGSDGKPAVIPLYEAQRMFRQDPSWQKTDNAYATYANVAQSLLQTWGFA